MPVVLGTIIVGHSQQNFCDTFQWNLIPRTNDTGKHTVQHHTEPYPNTLKQPVLKEKHTPALLDEQF
jgi:hypothetical protein